MEEENRSQEETNLCSEVGDGGRSRTGVLGRDLRELQSTSKDLFTKKA
jgi:hypothetical protein